jgi:hypothetical protein
MYIALSIITKRKQYGVDFDISSGERENRPVGVAEGGGTAF